MGDFVLTREYFCADRVAHYLDFGIDTFEFERNFRGVARKRTDEGLCTPEVLVDIPEGVYFYLAGVGYSEGAGGFADGVFFGAGDGCRFRVGLDVDVAAFRLCRDGLPVSLFDEVREDVLVEDVLQNGIARGDYMRFRDCREVFFIKNAGELDTDGIGMLGVRYFPEVDFFGARLFPVLLDASPVVTFRNLVPAVHLDGGIQFVQ